VKGLIMALGKGSTSISGVDGTSFIDHNSQDVHSKNFLLLGGGTFVPINLNHCQPKFSVYGFESDLFSLFELLYSR
jgi:hypothetical protein